MSEVSVTWECLVKDAVEARLTEIPESARRHLERVIADTIGVMVAGGRHREMVSLVQGGPLSSSWRTKDGAQLLVLGGGRSDPERVAFVNATAGTFLELDEGYRPCGHPAIHVLPAALAAAQVLHSSGRELLTAFLAGYEVTAGLFERYRLSYPLHPHGHLGAIGASTAVAVLRGVDPLPASRVAATTPLLTTWEPCFEGATTRNTYTGHAAAMGLTAHRLAEAGFSGSREALDAAFGGLVGCRTGDTEAEKIDWSTPRVTRNYLKLHSACALTHSALDAATQLPAVRPEEVKEVIVETVSANLKVARQAACNDLSARFSLPYAVAAALVHGFTGAEAFVYEQRVADLAKKVAVIPTADFESAWPGEAPARVTLWTADAVHSAMVRNPLGHHSRPLDRDRLDAKFYALVGRDGSDLLERLLGLEDVDDCNELFAGSADGDVGWY